tara:strand:+ start:261 stop:407 length:147 start_codon:yes stop_codon:yes gene_type:complete
MASQEDVLKKAKVIGYEGDDFMEAQKFLSEHGLCVIRDADEYYIEPWG